MSVAGRIARQQRQRRDVTRVVHLVLPGSWDRVYCGIERRREIIVDHGNNPYVPGAVHATDSVTRVTCIPCTDAWRTRP